MTNMQLVIAACILLVLIVAGFLLGIGIAWWTDRHTRKMSEQAVQDVLIESAVRVQEQDTPPSLPVGSSVIPRRRFGDLPGQQQRVSEGRQWPEPPQY